MFLKAFNYVAYSVSIGQSSAIRYAGTSLLPGQMNFLFKAGNTMWVNGLTTNCGASLGGGYPLNPGDVINSDGAAQLWFSTIDGKAVDAYVLVSRSQGFEGQS